MKNQDYDKDRLEVVFSPETIQSRIRELGREINEFYRGRPLVAVCVLKGAFIFFADLVRELDLDVTIDFVRLSSYADRTARQDRILFSKDMETSVVGRDVLVIEDIVDTGHSMAFLVKVLNARGPNSVRIAALVDKYERREAEVRVDFSGFKLREGFIVGYGLDYAEKYRHKPGIYELTPGQGETS
ncbi:MAG: hypoxanthine phosphoribosyltransferase [Deltaproteobacteria bacterium]|nr:hypoxanthine phosphoribosyltransferase [Deltaproteobacteria bacterium]